MFRPPATYAHVAQVLQDANNNGPNIQNTGNNNQATDVSGMTSYLTAFGMKLVEDYVEEDYDSSDDLPISQLVEENLPRQGF